MNSLYSGNDAWDSTRIRLLSERHPGAGIEQRPQFPEAFQRIEAAGDLAMTVRPFVVARRKDERVIEAIEPFQTTFQNRICARLSATFDVARVDDPLYVVVRR